MALYRKKLLQEMEEWTPTMDMSGVSVSEADANKGSPMQGDMIAKNPNNNKDRWLVAKQFFDDNYEAI